MVSFHISGIPQAMPVRDDQTGLVVDGFRVTVVSNETGSRAVLEIPASRYSVETVRAAADEQLGKLDASLAAFPKPSAAQ